MKHPNSTTSPIIGVVILNDTTYADAINLVTKLQQQTIVEQLRIVVVDNASANNSYEPLNSLEEKYANVTMLQTSENLGYAKGISMGMKHLRETMKPEYVAILNSDVILPDDCFERLCCRYSAFEKAGIIAPLMLDTYRRRNQLSDGSNTYTDECLNLFFAYHSNEYNSVREQKMNSKSENNERNCISRWIRNKIVPDNQRGKQTTASNLRQTDGLLPHFGIDVSGDS